MHASLRPALAFVGAALLFVGAARADDVAQARDAYDRGARAVKSGDYARAASEFAKADALAPSPTALEAALDAAVQADDPELGAELLARSRRGAVSGSLAESVAAAHAKFDGRGGLLRVPCPRPTCSVTVDGRAVDATKPVWANKGAHTVVRQDATGASATFPVEVKPDATVELQEPPPAVPAEPAREARKKLPPFVFFAGAGLTLAAGVATVAFGLDANGTHDDFESIGCRRGGAPATSCAVLRDEGKAAETRADVAFVSTLVLGAAVGVVGLLLTDWSGGKSKDQRAKISSTIRF